MSTDTPSPSGQEAADRWERGPSVESLAPRPFVALRHRTPMSGIAAAADTLAPLADALHAARVDVDPPPFFRYLVIDMDAELVLDVGWPVAVIPSVEVLSRVVTPVA